MIVQQIVRIRDSSSELEGSAAVFGHAAVDLEKKSGLLVENVGVFKVVKAG